MMLSFNRRGEFGKMYLRLGIYHVFKLLKSIVLYRHENCIYMSRGDVWMIATLLMASSSAEQALYIHLTPRFPFA